MAVQQVLNAVLEQVDEAEMEELRSGLVSEIKLFVGFK